MRQVVFGIQIFLNYTIGYLFLRALAFYLGVSEEKSAFDIAYSIPFLIITLSGFHWLHGLVIAHFDGISKSNTEKANRHFGAILNAMLLVSLVLCLGVLCFLDPFATLIAPGLDRSMQLVVSELIVVFLPMVIFSGISTYFSAVLISYGFPIAMEVGAMVTKTIALLALLVMGGGSVYFVAYLLSVASFISFVFFLLLIAHKTSLQYRLCLIGEGEELARLLRQSALFFVPAILAQVASLLLRSLASLNSPESVAGLTYSLSLIGPLSVLIGKPIALSNSSSFLKDWKSATKLQRKRLLRNFFLRYGLPCLAVSCLFATYSNVLISIMFSGGAFDQQATHVTAQIFSICAYSLPALVLLWVFLFPLLSSSSVLVAPVVYAVGYLAQILLSVVFFRYVGLPGLLYAYVLAPVLQVALATFVLVKEEIKE